MSPHLKNAADRAVENCARIFHFDTSIAWRGGEQNINS